MLEIFTDAHFVESMEELCLMPWPLDFRLHKNQQLEGILRIIKHQPHSGMFPKTRLTGIGYKFPSW